MKADSARVVFFGYGELAVAGLDALTEVQARITALVVPSNRTGADVEVARRAAVARGVPVWIQPGRSQIATFVDQLRAAAPDVLVVWSYSMILPGELLQVPRLGAVNVHGGLLPEYRGGHVMQWAMINGEAETGVTLHYMDAGVDTGPLIAQHRFSIDADDDAVTVKTTLKTAGSQLLKEWWPRIAGGTAPRQPQDESRARYWRMRTPEDGLIDWSMPASHVVRLVRALACNDPGAYVKAGDRTLSVKRAERLESADAHAKPGQIVNADASGVRIAGVGGDVLVVEAFVDGTRMLPSQFAGLMGAKTHV